MGINISGIITCQFEKIDNEVVHFIENDLLIVPINVDSYDLMEFSNFAVNYENINDLIKFLKEKDSEEKLYFDNENDYGIDIPIHSIKMVSEIIEKLNLQTFIIEHYSDHADIPMDWTFLAVIDGKIIKESKMSLGSVEDDYGDSEIEEKYRTLIAKNYFWYTLGEGPYHDFEQAYLSYHKIDNDSATL